VSAREPPIIHPPDSSIGIGLMMARALEANGAATVYIVGRRMEALEAAVKQSVRSPPTHR
jgi:NADP-dependent 3-hydroxy acid dehydrogenase YdfG